MAREEGKLDLGCASDDAFHDGLVAPPPSATAHSSRSERRPNQLFIPVERRKKPSCCCCRSTSACVSPLAEEAGENCAQQIKALGWSGFDAS